MQSHAVPPGAGSGKGQSDLPSLLAKLLEVAFQHGLWDGVQGRFRRFARKEVIYCCCAQRSVLLQLAHVRLCPLELAAGHVQTVVDHEVMQIFATKVFLLIERHSRPMNGHLVEQFVGDYMEGGD